MEAGWAHRGNERAVALRVEAFASKAQIAGAGSASTLTKGSGYLKRILSFESCRARSGIGNGADSAAHPVLHQNDGVVIFGIGCARDLDDFKHFRVFRAQSFADVGKFVDGHV